MKYGTIQPPHFAVVEANDLDEAKLLVGLQPLQVDHGQISSKLSIVVYEFGLFDPPEIQTYFSIGPRLYAGSAVVYQIDQKGETVDLDQKNAQLVEHYLRFFANYEAVEAAIRSGDIERPVMRMNGKLIWSWPGPAPFDIPNDRRRK